MPLGPLVPLSRHTSDLGRGTSKTLLYPMSPIPWARSHGHGAQRRAQRASPGLDPPPDLQSQALTGSRNLKGPGTAVLTFGPETFRFQVGQTRRGVATSAALVGPRGGYSAPGHACEFTCGARVAFRATTLAPLGRANNPRHAIKLSSRQSRPWPRRRRSPRCPWPVRPDRDTRPQRAPPPRSAPSAPAANRRALRRRTQ